MKFQIPEGHMDPNWPEGGLLTDRTRPQLVPTDCTKLYNAALSFDLSEPCETAT